MDNENMTLDEFIEDKIRKIREYYDDLDSEFGDKLIRVESDLENKKEPSDTTDM